MQTHTLLAVTGMSPQVVTETIYAFYQKGQHIDKIKIITTSRGKKEIWLNLMVGKHDQPAMLQQLINDYKLPPITFDESDILVITNNQGEPLDDARTESEHQAMANFITQVVQHETESTEQVLHASIAGGRKTMTFLLGYAMSLYARPNDTLSHVLVAEPYESSDFYYPTPYSQAIRTRFGTTEDAKEAQVNLALIPFVRMRQELPEQLLAGKVSYTQAVESLNLAHQHYNLVIDYAALTLTIDQLIIRLSPIDFAFYLWVLHTTQEQGMLGAPKKNNPIKSYADELIKHYTQITDYIVAEELYDTAFNHEQGIGMEMQYFSERKSRINREIKQGFGQQLAKQVGIHTVERKHNTNYVAIALPHEQITINKKAAL